MQVGNRLWVFKGVMWRKEYCVSFVQFCPSPPFWFLEQKYCLILRIRVPLLLSSGMWDRIICWILINVSEERTDCTLKVEAVSSSEMLITFCKAKYHHFPEDSHLPSQRYEIHKCRAFCSTCVTCEMVVIAQMVRQWLHTVKSWVQSWMTSFEIHYEQSGIGENFVRFHLVIVQWNPFKLFCYFPFRLNTSVKLHLSLSSVFSPAAPNDTLNGELCSF
jgi:hypothetical protein